MRVLWLTEHYPPGRGGMARSCDRIVHGLRQQGMVIDVVHCTRRLERPRVESKMSGRYIGFPIGDDPAHGLNTLWNLLEADPERNNITHLVAFGGVLSLLAGPIYAAWLGVPLITLFRGNDFDAGILSPKRSDIVRRAIEASSRICVVSRDKQVKIARLYPESNPVWIPNGIDLDEWHASPSDITKGEMWRADNVTDNRRVIGVVGQIKRKKGVLLFLETLLESGFSERFHLMIVGEIDEEVGAFLEANNETIHHTVHPFTDRFDLLASYSACDFVAIPSFYDGTPNVLLESAALGIPSIAARAGGMADFLEEGIHGFLFHPGDRHECHHAILHAATITDADLQNLRLNCKNLAHEKFNHHTEAEQYKLIITN